MISKVWLYVSILVIVCLALVSANSVTAQNPPPQPPGDRHGPYGLAAQRAAGARLGGREGTVPAGAQHRNQGQGSLVLPGVEAQGDISALAASTDVFGYVKKAAAFNWFDASAGTSLDFSTAESLPVPLPFSFPFYEHSYDTANLTQYGYLTFSAYPYVDWQSAMLAPYEPNNLIAPYWAPIYMTADSRIYMATGGDAPDRYVVFEWKLVSDYYTKDDDTNPNQFTFEVVLFENGNILFQYADMDYTWGYSHPSAGIEDSTGATGLVSLKFAAKQKSYQAVQFTRPVTSISLKLYPTDYGAFAGIGGTANYHLSIINTGMPLEDVFDLKISSKWPAVAYQADGVTPLTDTDGDRKIDTGVVASGDTVDVVIRVTTPATAKVGDSKTTTVTFTSSNKTSRKKSAYLTTTIPAPFTQVSMINELGKGGSVYAQNFSPTGGDQGFMVAEDAFAYDPAAARMSSGGGFYLWSEYACPDEGCMGLYYAIYDAGGVQVLPRTALAVPPAGTWYYAAAPAAAPNGNVGVIYVSEEEVAPGQLIYNLYLAVLDGTGNVIAGPTNLTNNTSIDIEFFSPEIVADETSRYLVAFDRYDYQNPPLENVYLGAYNEDGSELRAPLAITADTGWEGGYYGPSLTLLSGGKLLVAYNGWKETGKSWTDYACYAVFENTGADVVRPETKISLGRVESYDMDSTLMSNGQVLLTWGAYKGSRDSIFYAVLKDVTYNKAKGPVIFTVKPALTGSWYVSATSDAAGHGILTWADDYQSFGRHLYYTLVGNNGALLTKPVIFLTAPENYFLYLNDFGYGNMPSLAP